MRHKVRDWGPGEGLKGGEGHGVETKYPVREGKGEGGMGKFGVTGGGLEQNLLEGNLAKQIPFGVIVLHH